MSKEINNEVKDNTPLTEEELKDVNGGKLQLSDEQRNLSLLGTCDLYSDIPTDCPNKPCTTCSHYTPVSYNFSMSKSK